MKTREPMKCLDQALKDFDAGNGIWYLEDREETASFASKAEIVRALTLARDYCALRNKLDAITVKLCVPLEGWEEKKKAEEMKKAEEKAAEEKRLLEEKQKREEKRRLEESEEENDGEDEEEGESKEADWEKESDRVLGYRYEEKDEET